MLPVRNVRLDIAYDGTDFSGWQRQPGHTTVQGSIETALERTLGEAVRLTASGRTDAGVHAARQVANFRTSNRIGCPNLRTALNNALPRSVRILSAAEVSPTFHARFDVVSKTYRYRILQGPICSPFIARFVHHERFPLDHSSMSRAAQAICGEHDFASFAGSRIRELSAASSPGGEAHSTVRRVFRSRLLWRPRTSLLVYEVCGNGFLYHMVRNIAGTLIEIGRGKMPAERMVEILQSRCRALAGPTAPSSGLCLMRVDYAKAEE